MPQLLIELFSEEIPARMQEQAARDFERMAREHLTAAGLTPETLRTFAGPRRLTLVAEGLPAAQADRSEEVKGPRTSAPEQALEGVATHGGGGDRHAEEGMDERAARLHGEGLREGLESSLRGG